MTEIFDQIRKLYLFASPSDELMPDIEFFSETDLASASAIVQDREFTVKLFPSFTPTIWLNLGHSYQLCNGSKSYHIDERADVLVLRSQTIERRNTPSDNIFTVKFFPGGFERIFGVSQTVIANDVIPLKDLIPERIINAIKKAPDFQSRIILWEDYLMEKKAQHAPKHDLNAVRKSIDVFLATEMKLSLNQLSEKVYMSEKTLNRYFNHVIGIGPKKYFNTLRARTSLTAFLGAPDQFSSQAYGYYDMSHFYRDALVFTGTRLALR